MLVKLKTIKNNDGNFEKSLLDYLEQLKLFYPGEDIVAVDVINIHNSPYDLIKVVLGVGGGASSSVSNMFFPIEYAENGNVAPTQAEIVSEDNSIFRIRQFSKSTGSYVIFPMQLGDYSDVTKVKFRLWVYLKTGGMTTGSAIFNVNGYAKQNGDVIGGALGVATEVLITGVYSIKSLVMSEWFTVDITDYAADSFTFLKVERDTADTYAEELGLVGLEFKYE